MIFRQIFYSDLNDKDNKMDKSNNKNNIEQLHRK